jgi:hypothetical protein
VEPSFVELLSLFEKVELPFEIRLDDFEKNKTKAVTEILANTSRKRNSREEQRILMQFTQDELYISRMGPPAVLPIARFYPDEKTIAVIYMSYLHGFSYGSRYKLALFNIEGDILSKQKDANLAISSPFLLGQSSPYGVTQTFSIDANGLIIQKTYKAIWKNDLKENGIINNEITDYVLEKTEQFKLSTSGVLAVKIDEGSKDRASLDY